MNTNLYEDSPDPNPSEALTGRVLLMVVLAITTVALISEGSTTAMTVLGEGLLIIMSWNEQ
ncbi:hypothetical protein [Nocardia farcinica]|uniref:hypothetical protein n=1 Tax=Nocardia farcinica TaxID=37329 RepID=UPI00245558C8|nr:hypothetical protein [Nocardia farcinica]